MIHLHVPSIPISANNAYLTMLKRKGKKSVPMRVLTKEGRRYKAETKTHLARRYPKEMQYFKPDKPYVLVILFVFSERKHLYNETWPDMAKSRYKKLDVGNRLKLFEDALCEATSIDDSHHWCVTVRKEHGPEDATHVWVWNEEDVPNNPITDIVRELRNLHAAPAAQPH